MVSGWTYAALGVALCLAVAGPSPAHADDPPTQAQVAQARARFRAAEAARDAGEFSTAARNYLDAYKALPDAEFLFNAGQMYILAGDLQNARVHLEKYLVEDPNGRAVDEARRALATLPPPAEPRPTEGTIGATAAGGDPTSITSGPVERPPPESPGRGLRIAGLVIASGGVATLGTGVFFGLRARSIAGEAKDWDMYDPERDAQGERAEKLMIVFTGIGAAAVITGGVLYYLGHRARTSAETALTIAPLASGDVTGFAVEGSF